MSQAPTKLTATIIAAHGRHYLAEAGGVKLQCVTRGKKTNVAVGDIVDVTMTSPDQGVIDKIEERKTLLYRSDQYKSKLLAANLMDRLVQEPNLPEAWLLRARYFFNSGRADLAEGDLARITGDAADRPEVVRLKARVTNVEESGVWIGTEHLPKSGGYRWTIAHQWLSILFFNGIFE